MRLNEKNDPVCLPNIGAFYLPIKLLSVTMIFMDVVYASFHTLQCGDIPKRGTVLRTLLSGSSRKWPKGRGFSPLVSFCDVVTAFYSAFREFIAPLRHNDVESVEVPNLFAAALTELLQEPPLLEKYAVDTILRAQTSDICTNRCSILKGSHSIACTKEHTCPGDSLVCILFNTTVVPVIDNFKARISIKFLLPSPLCVAERPFLTAVSSARNEHSPRAPIESSYADGLAAFAARHSFKMFDLDARLVINVTYIISPSPLAVWPSVRRREIGACGMCGWQKNALAHVDVSAYNRVTFLSSIATFMFTSNACSWFPLGKTLKDKFESALTAVYRTATKRCQKPNAPCR